MSVLPWSCWSGANRFFLLSLIHILLFNRSILVAQFFGILPVTGVLDRDIRNLNFKWSSARVIYCLLFILVGGFEVGLMMFKAFTKKFSIVTVGIDGIVYSFPKEFTFYFISELIMFYFDSVAQTCVFLYISTKWKVIINYWSRKEIAFLYDPYTIGNLTRKVIILGAVFCLFYLTEHFMFIAMEWQYNKYQIQACNVTMISPLNNYMRRERPHILDVIDFRWWIFPLFQWTITLLSFGWIFVDFFIILLSLSISTRFHQLNNRLQTTTQQEMDDAFWLDIRLHYTNLVDLTQFIDDRISLLVLFSLSHNLFLVCSKIFEAIR